ncbi:MAG: DUF4388 domain-containing protein [Blastocatellia bacterium]|nr:DUF4388 domain-containing protein [Blastocatellia bacterium]
MSNMEPTRRLDKLNVPVSEENDHGSPATLIVLRNKKVVTSITLEEPTTVIGRSPECTIPLVTDSEASRQHAQVAMSVTTTGIHQYFLKDLGSTNGTILNGNLLTSLQDTLLKDNDQFTIGQHLFKFALLDQSKEKFLTGNLTQISLFDLVQIIENNRLTCTLTIRTQGLLGRICFNEGQIVDSEVENVRGLDAFRQLAALEEGFFEVEKSENGFVPNILASSNMNLVLDTLRELDEERAGYIPEDDHSASEMVLDAAETTREQPDKATANESIMQQTMVRGQALIPLEPLDE